MICSIKYFGDDTLVEKHQFMQVQLKKDLIEIPFKQRSVMKFKRLRIKFYYKCAAIVKAYQLDGHIMKEIGKYFKTYYSVPVKL